MTGCASGKIPYFTRREALQVKRRLRKQRGGLSAYRCDLCGFWHLGRLPAAVKQGRRPRPGRRLDG